MNQRPGLGAVNISDLLVAGAQRTTLRTPRSGGDTCAAELITPWLDAFVPVVGQGHRRPALGTVLTNTPESVGLVLAAAAAKVPLVSLPLPARGMNIARYIRVLNARIASANVTTLIVGGELGTIADQIGCQTMVVTEEDRESIGPVEVAPSQFAITQYSSGTGGTARPTCLSDGELGANVRSILNRVDLSSNLRAASWLPLSHDMGLVGMLFGTVASAGLSPHRHSFLYLAEPSRFMRAPANWLERTAYEKIELTTTPSFALDHILRHVPHRVSDLGAMRVWIVGAEPINARAIREIEKALGRFGLSETSMCPAYGLAEVGVAASLTPPDEPWRVKRIDLVAALGGKLRPGSHEVVSSGPPLGGYSIEVIDGDAVGDIRIGGASGGASHDAGPFGLQSDWINTSDVAFIENDWVFVLGRSDDVVIRRGQKYLATDLEQKLARARGVRKGRAIVVGLPGPRVAVAFERDTDCDLSVGQIHTEIRRRLREVSGLMPDMLIEFDRGELPFTPSGKPIRHEVTQQLLAELL